MEEEVVEEEEVVDEEEEEVVEVVVSFSCQRYCNVIVLDFLANLSSF